jgi:ADP-ribose pyrophosphatase
MPLLSVVMSSEPAEEWNLLDEDPAYSGWVTITRRSFQMPDGQVSEWDIIDGSRTVAIVARVATGEFLMVRQYRPGPMRILDELPGGYARSGETVEQTATRELLEETGYRAGTAQLIGSTWMTANSSVERFVVLAEGCTKVAEPNFDRDEFGQVLLVDAATFINKVRRGQLTDQGVAYRVLDQLGLLG